MSDSSSSAAPPPGGQIRDQLLDEEMRTSYLTYAMSVIIQRALPDARDGLKPSQRRILVAMNDLNLGPRTKFRKCAKIAGDTTGNYHPHGDQVVYPTLVRLAQDFNMRYPLIDKQGNFGAIDGSPPAAMRYTEARLAFPSVDMLDDLDKQTVGLERNYDDTRSEPTVLPARFPNLICNGSQGIAVGMATSIPPHNLTEVCDALIALIGDPDVSVLDLMEIVKGPDFPTGGIICGRTGVYRAYTTGRGLIVVRARTAIEQKGRDREQIVVTELPYQVNPVTIFEKVKTLISDKVIEGISYVNDETDRKDGLRLVFEIKKGHQADVVLNQLYRYTPLQNTFSMIMLALDGGRPRTFNLKEMLAAFRDHRVDVIQRRTRYLKRKAEERLHIVEGLLIAIANIDEVIKVIRSSPSTETAKERLIAQFVLSARQADAILAMRLARLTGLEVEKLDQEKVDLQGAIARYAEILGDVREVHQLVLDELEDLKVRYGDARRSEIGEDELGIEDEALIPEGRMLVTLSHHGYIKRMSPDLYRTQARGGKGITGADTKEGDFIERLILADNKDYFLFFTTWGQVHWLKVYRIPELGRNSQGRFIENLIGMRDENGESGRGKERVASIIPVKEFSPDHYLVTVSRNGYIKKTSLQDYSRPRSGGIIGAGLKEGDILVRVVLTDGTKDLMVSTSQGQTMRFSEQVVRGMGRGAAGVIALKFKKPGDHVVDMVVAEDDGMLLTVCANGYGMRTRMSDYPTKGRGGLGVVNIKGLDRNGDVVLVRALEEGEHVILMSEGGTIMRTPADEIRLVGRGSQGVRVMRLKADDRVASGVVVQPEEEELEGELEGEVEAEAVETDTPDPPPVQP
ncbi:MAG: DNA gyrase subunit A [Planctomycetes bacterium]|nr:DNA gyrase subunit A [Planctomycetota bacterium]